MIPVSAPTVGPEMGFVVSSPLGRTLLAVACAAIVCMVVALGTRRLTLRFGRYPLLSYRLLALVSGVVGLLALVAAIAVG